MKVGTAAGEKFYEIIRHVPECEAAWAQRQATIRSWRSDPGFEEYWPAIDQMLADDMASFRQRVAAMKAVGLEDYDFDAWREQREHDLTHAHDHLP